MLTTRRSVLISSSSLAAASSLGAPSLIRPAAAQTRTGAAQDATDDWREEYAYTLGIQAYVFGFPYVYLPSLRWDWVTQPKPPGHPAVRAAQPEFRLQDTQVQYETALYQLEAAKASQANAKLAMDSQIGGVNTTVAQIEANLADAKWQLDQTTVRAPGNGYVTLMALTVGDRALQARASMSFILTDEISIMGMFQPNGFQTIKPGATVKLVFDNIPGRIFHAQIVAIPEGVGQGQAAVSGTLARVGSVGGARAYPAEISIPADLDRAQLRLGMPGTAAVFAENAGAIGLLRSILVWISSYTAYL